VQRRTRATDPAQPSLAGHPARRRLTTQERDIALLVGDGLPDRAIAHRLALAPTTVATYVRRIRDRLDLAGLRDLEAWVNARRDPAHPEAGLRRVEASRPA
jgi:DNA-binding NarL/FixJ family response regulator